MKKLAIILLGSFFLFTCSEEQDITRPYPRVRTLDVVNVSGAGAIFTGEITFLAGNITDHGFVWAQNSSPILATDVRIALGPRSEKGKFEGTIETSLTEGVTYYVRAYVITNDYVVYGENQKFVSLGSKAPTIEKIEPNTGTWGDTLTISGTNFSVLSGKVEVRFNTSPGTVISSTATSIRVRVPDSLPPVVSDVSVISTGSTVRLDDAFSLLKPEIHTVSPESASVGKTILVEGGNFHSRNTKAFIGTLSAPVSNLSNKKVTVTVPAGTPAGPTTIKVVTGENDFFATAPFVVNGPMIDNVEPLTGTFEDIVTIKGSFDQSNVTVLFDNIFVSPTLVSATEIKIIVPVELSQAENYIHVISGGQETVFPEPFILKTPVLFNVTPSRISSFSEITIDGDFFNSFVEGNEVFVGNSRAEVKSSTRNQIIARAPVYFEGHQAKVSVRVADVQSKEDVFIESPWAKIADFPGGRIYNGVSIVIGEKAYIGLSAADGEVFNEFWEFNLPSLSWRRLKDFPGEFRQYPVCFSSNKKVYIGPGYEDGPKDFWEYDVSTDTWNQKLPLPFFSSQGQAVGFSNEIDAYVAYRSNNNVNSLWKYNSLNDSWTQTTTQPYSFFPQSPSQCTTTDFFVVANPQYIVAFNYSTEMWSIKSNASGIWVTAICPDGDNLFVVDINAQVWRSNQENSGWIRDHAMMGDAGSPRTFYINEKMYVIQGNMVLEFDPKL